MSQLNLTPEEDQIVADAIRSKANQYNTMFGVNDPALQALIAKIEGQLPVAESAPAAIEVVEPESNEETPKAKKSKAVEK